jgi:cysteine desulfurase
VPSVYLDCAATTPVDPRVAAEAMRYMEREFGNAGSRTHDYGARARRAIERARDQVAAVAGCTRGEVVFTSGATESNNLAILGLAAHGRRTGRTHLVASAIEHNAVLEPLQHLAENGFTLTLVPPTSGGYVDPQTLRDALRPETLLVSVMQVNNETGIRQPITEIAEELANHEAYFHVDAAQGFGKELECLRHPRVDLISVSGHKLFAPKGVGALIARRRNGERPPIQPLMFGGGQERGLRPGTVPVHLVAALGLACELAVTEREARTTACRSFGEQALAALAPLQPQFTGDPAHRVPHILNLAIPGLDAEEVIEAWSDLAAISNGSACTSQSTTCSHVLSAMGFTGDRAAGAVRLSWCHTTPTPDWGGMVEAIRPLHRRIREGEARLD